jgi:tetratricopeptide (TPR) repeat protein
MNYDAALADGVSLLQLFIYDHQMSEPDLLTKAQIQLLKSAKLDSAKADPFALLGICYEIQKDIKRAIGCYSKSLLIDPSHPVAGRGMLRLKVIKDLSLILKRAMEQGMFLSGWAWKASGDQSAFVESEYERAVICYQHALRCHDICSPCQHRLHIFFSLHDSSKSYCNEVSKTWSSLGACYRYLGKYSAALRAFEAAYEEDNYDMSYFCSWAQGKKWIKVLGVSCCLFVHLTDLVPFSRTGTWSVQ